MAKPSSRDLTASRPRSPWAPPRRRRRWRPRSARCRVLALSRSALLCAAVVEWIGWRLAAGWDVVVVPEQVGRVPAALDRDQPFPGRPRVGLADAGRSVVAEEVHVGAVVDRAQAGREPLQPPPAHRLVL